MSLSLQRMREVIACDPTAGLLSWKASGKVAGCRRRDGYLAVRIDRRLYLAHRLVWLYARGEWPAEHIDHINGDRSDNRIENLRDVSPHVNSQNRRTVRKETQSTYLGVWKNHKGWQAVLTVAGARRCLGTFKTPEEAHAAYVAAKRVHHEGCTL